MRISTNNDLRSLARVLNSIVFLIIMGCASVGPEYDKPDLSAPKTWHTKLEDGLTSRPADPQTLAEWWATLNDPVLNNLIIQAVAGNLDVKQARARVREARANRRLNRADLFPTLDATGSFRKSRSSENSGGGTDVDQSALDFDASWELDIFGGIRRSMEAATADLQASQEDLRDVLVSLLAEVAINYVDVRTYQARIKAAEGNLKAQTETYELTRSRCLTGLATELAVQQGRYNMENTRSEIPILKTGLEEALNQLAVLLGEQPGAVHAVLQQQTPIPVTPLEVAVGVPANALRQRPDVRKAERNLAAQTARVGEATAELYPKFTLVGTIGLETLSLSDLFTAGSRTYSIGPSVSLPIFNAGAIRSNIEIQSALQEQALAQYEAAVLNALQEVENALVAYAQEQNRRAALKEATDAARQAAILAQNQYNAGMIDFSDVLDAQRSLLSFQDQLANSEGTMTANLVRLYKALGGGWTSLEPAVEMQLKGEDRDLPS